MLRDELHVTRHQGVVNVPLHLCEISLPKPAARLGVDRSPVGCNDAPNQGGVIARRAPVLIA